MRWRPPPAGRARTAVIARRNRGPLGSTHHRSGEFVGTVTRQWDRVTIQERERQERDDTTESLCLLKALK